MERNSVIYEIFLFDQFPFGYIGVFDQFPFGYIGVIENDVELLVDKNFQ